ncbi:HAD family hydrolase [Paenibacillus pinisoli]|uniref:HAD family hydrolase n=1 Tax=Paenibacillus pinisoli TaxID=1276110 RepID=A0A3A6PHH1_9BACL|nr:HAD family hydrolase [Paenibacillus pinisoli]RJX37619.1 HAD family hydrolase [Paenibacillus pinisoli]
MYQTFIFDVDGTLIDTEKAVLGSLQKMLMLDYGQHLETEQLTFVLGIPGADALPRFGIKDIDRANERWNEYMVDFAHTIHVFNGIKDLLAALNLEGVMTGIVTSKTTEELHADFVPHGLMGELHHVVCADDTARHKPHPEPLLKFLELSGADPAASLYIGDTIYDAQCARDAGIDFALALWGCGNPDTIEARYKLNSPIELLELINRRELAE